MSGKELEKELDALVCKARESYDRLPDDYVYSASEITQSIHIIIDREVQKVTDSLRARFLNYLTADSETQDKRRREFNQAIFDADEGFAIWTGTDLGMVMDKFDKALNGGK